MALTRASSHHVLKISIYFYISRGLSIARKELVLLGLILEPLKSLPYSLFSIAGADGDDCCMAPAGSIELTLVLYGSFRFYLPFEFADLLTRELHLSQMHAIYMMHRPTRALQRPPHLHHSAVQSHGQGYTSGRHQGCSLRQADSYTMVELSVSSLR